MDGFLAISKMAYVLYFCSYVFSLASNVKNTNYSKYKVCLHQNVNTLDVENNSDPGTNSAPALEANKNVLNNMIVHMLTLSATNKKYSNLNAQFNEDYHVYSKELKTPINTAYKPICAKKKFHGCYMRVENISSNIPIEEYLKKLKIDKPGRLYLLTMKILWAKYLRVLQHSDLCKATGIWMLTPEPMLDCMIDFVKKLNSKNLEVEFYDLLTYRSVMDKCVLHILILRGV